MLWARVAVLGCAIGPLVAWLLVSRRVSIRARAILASAVSTAAAGNDRDPPPAFVQCAKHPLRLRSWMNPDGATADRIPGGSPRRSANPWDETPSNAPPIRLVLGIALRQHRLLVPGLHVEDHGEERGHHERDG